MFGSDGLREAPMAGRRETERGGAMSDISLQKNNENSQRRAVGGALTSSAASQ
jgi:hypothetical protein